LGELLGSLRDADALAQNREMNSLVTRAYRLTTSTNLSAQSTPDRIAGQLTLLEHLDAAGHLIGPSGNASIAMSANGIEALTRDLWPDDFRTLGPRSSLDKVLDDRSRSSDPQECRFAQIARTLRKQYRNPVEHSHSTDFSWHEARFFHDGLRVLLELHRKLKTTTGD